jgi:hypothetical protein
MVYAVSSTEAMPRRKVMKSPGNGAERWRTEYFGPVGTGQFLPGPQAFMIDMREDDEILPHFHEVDQFQVFVAGGGSIGRKDEGLEPVTVHYADRYTGYGPILAGPGGSAYFTLRARTDPGPVYLHQPGYRDRLRPSAKRHFSQKAALSTPAVMQARASVLTEPVAGDPAGTGPRATMIRAGAGVAFQSADPAGGGGYFLLVLQGGIEYAGQGYPAWSVLFVAPDDQALALRAGDGGCELIQLSFDAQDPPQAAA